MTLILLLIFAVIIFGIVLLLSVVRGVSSFLSGKPNSYTHNDSDYYSATDHEKRYSQSKKPHEKIFKKNEGEYVSYEEIKE